MPDTMTPADKIEVMNLIANYAFRLDTADLDGYVDNFAPDGVFDSTAGRFEGRAAIRDFVARLLGNRTAGTSSSLRHIMGIPTIHGEGERCRAETYVMIPGGTEDGQIRVQMVGTYTDEIVKVDGRWRFAVRHIRMALTNASTG